MLEKLTKRHIACASTCSTSTSYECIMTIDEYLHSCAVGAVHCLVVASNAQRLLHTSAFATERDGDATFCQIMMDTCYYCCLPVPQ